MQEKEKLIELELVYQMPITRNSKKKKISFC